VRITDSDGKPLKAVDLFLSREEAKALLYACANLLATDDDQPFHAHINDPRYEWEVTVYRERDAPPSSFFARPS
jgi:hypothetical protein